MQQQAEKHSGVHTPWMPELAQKMQDEFNRRVLEQPLLPRTMADALHAKFLRTFEGRE